MLIKDWLKEHGVEYTKYNDHFVICACAVGDNFYDYGETPKEIEFDEEFEWMANDPLFYIIDCSECGGCSGW